MDRRIHVTVAAILIGWLAFGAPSARAINKVDLQEQVKAHINERMYDCCRSVTLTERPDGVFEGFALLINGLQSPLEVRISGSEITYTFTRLTPPASVPVATEPADKQPPDNGPPAVVTAADSTASATPDTDDTFTSSMYDQIQKGMGYRQVADILGAAGEQLSSSYFDGAANQVYVWANPDDSHICIIFRDGLALLKTQAGLPGIAPLPPFEGQKDEAADSTEFNEWLLVRETDGRMVLTGLSLGQWIEKAGRSLSSVDPNKPASIEVIEQDDGLAVKLVRADPKTGPHDTLFYLKCLSPEEAGVEVPPGGQIEAVCVPTRMTADGRDSGPAQAWKAMADLAGLSPSGPSAPQ